MFKMNKKGVAIGLVPLVLLVIGGYFVFTSGMLGDMLGAGVDGVPSRERTVACNVEDVSLKWNDLNEHKKGTDPASALYIYGGDITPQSVADDGSVTVATDSNIRAIAGEDSTTYFSELVDINVGCSDPFYLSAELAEAGAPTVTLLNDDGVTKNSASAEESMGASSTYTTTVSLRAPADKCSSRHGAIVAVSYDATFINKVESDLDTASVPIFALHTNTTLDQWATFEYDGQLCDNEKDEFVLTFSSSSSDPTQDVVIHWLPQDIDKDESTLDPITGIYDEDNNFIGIGNSTKTYFIN